MANIAGLDKIKMPKFTRQMAPEDARAIRNYLTQMQEQLKYILCNLDTENMAEGLKEKLKEL